MSDRTLELDLLVLGSGSAGRGAARRCAEGGLATAIVEDRAFGGTCPLRGCDPKRLLVGVAEAVEAARRLRGTGITAEALELSWPEAMAFKRSYTRPIPEQVEAGLREAGVRTLDGKARFEDASTVLVDGDGTQRIRARRFLVATGARPRPLEIPGASLLTTSDGFLGLAELPRRICFVGGGYVSFEFAHLARHAGAEEVTVLHRGARPLEGFDPDLVDALVEHTRGLGIDVRLERDVTAVERADGALQVRFDGPGGEGKVTCDLAVHGAGRVPRLEGLGLEEAGVRSAKRGVVVTPALRSVSNPRVYAAGDAADAGAPPLTPVAGHHARVAARNLLAGRDEAHVDHGAVPSVVFTDPPLARIGMLESEARAEGLELELRHDADTTGWYSSLRLAAPASGYKLLLERGSGRILGGHFLGPGAEEQVNVLAAALRGGLDADALGEVLFAYPSWSSDLGSML